MKAALFMFVCFGLLTKAATARSQTAKPQTPTHSANKNSSTSKILEVDDVLEWRTPFEDLFGKSKDVAVERFGPPDKQRETRLVYFGNAKTSFREIFVFVRNDRISGIKVFASPRELLPVDRVIMRAKMFCFSSGTFEDSTDDYFEADTADGRSSIQFTITPRGIGLAGVYFSASPLECDPASISVK
jgi:hypothetical protein